MMKNLLALTGGLSVLLGGCTSSPDQSENKNNEQGEEKPNIIYIVADDLGYGELSCYGQEKYNTPNIDELSDNGMRFLQHYSGSTVSAPSRSVLLTGLHTGHTPIRGNIEIQPEGQAPLPAESFTLAEALQKEGYRTGAYGKWGLGIPGSEGDPNKQGFDQFYGYICQRMAHRYYPEYLWHNGEKVFLEGNDWTQTETYAPDVIQDSTLQFLERNKDRSFFLYMPMIQPHAELIVPEDSIFQRYKGKYPEEPYVNSSQGSDYGDDSLIIGKYTSQKYPRATFAAMVRRIDLYVGQVMEKLRELGIEDHTIIMFTSDNGPHKEGGADPEFFNSNGKYRGHKRDLYEGGIRVPLVVNWPGVVEKGSTSDHPSAFWDVFPTLCDITGVDIPDNIDGISFLPELTGNGPQPKHDYLYWEFHGQSGKKAVLKHPWKAVKPKIKPEPGAPVELYNLDKDPGESINVADKHPEIVREMKTIMEEARVPSEKFQFGLSSYKGE